MVLVKFIGLNERGIEGEGRDEIFFGVIFVLFYEEGISNEW